MISDLTQLTTETDHYSDLLASAFLVLGMQLCGTCPERLLSVVLCGIHQGRRLRHGFRQHKDFIRGPVTTLGVGDPSVARAFLRVSF